ncbi:hypothetical protein OKA05_27040 [Luteolibacter arcticus]|uniref:Addiction module protein n=1 Tax=Luteolibacter arcticus TaxID=1581411 RepID=A0ABT3GRW4_9BACT|nr:hypothetical protein [Luteolibacter arcticus]MCW1926243.1 hypothetical protein [Luteolibacter arcticus]
MKLEEIFREAEKLPQGDRAKLAATLLQTLPVTLADEDDGIAEARRRSRELDEQPELGCSWEDVKKSLGR